MIVAGAGIIGLACAWRLSQGGADVTVFDAREPAAEASWSGAGMLAPGGEVEGASALADMCVRSLALYPEFVAELNEESGLPIDFRVCGAFEQAASEARAAAQAEIGIPSRAAERYGIPGRLYPEDAQVDPRDVTRALLVACRRRGVHIIEDEPVLEVLEQGAAVRTRSGVLRDPEGVLIAAGAWSSVLVPDLPRVFPVRGHLIGYHLKPGLLEVILRHEHTYILQRRSGFLVAGSTTEHVGFDRRIDPEIVQDLHRRACALLPELELHQPDDAWIGFRPGIASHTPMIGCAGNSRVFTAFGHYRNGILLAPETARIIRAEVLNL